MHRQPHYDSRGYCCCGRECCIGREGRCECDGCACPKPGCPNRDGCHLCRPKAA